MSIWQFVALHQSPDSADKVLKEIGDVCALLPALPEYGRARDDLRKDIRSSRAGRYVIFYRARNDVTEIVRVLHERRDVDAIFDGQS